MKPSALRASVLACVVACMWTGWAADSTQHTHPQSNTIHIAIMDPLAAELSCPCVPDYAQRKYAFLGQQLSVILARPVEIQFCTSLQNATNNNAAIPDYVIGKKSIVEYDAQCLEKRFLKIASLTDKSGSIFFTGLFVVPTNSSIKTIRDLSGKKILFGPAECEEKSAAAFAALAEAGLAPVNETNTVSACTLAAAALVAGKADAAVISSYAEPLLAGCHVIEPGALRIIGSTKPIEFIAAYSTGTQSEKEVEQMTRALKKASNVSSVRKKMETKNGFVPSQKNNDHSQKTSARDWPDWRGPNRDGISPFVPASLPEKPDFLWRFNTASLGLGGIAVSEKYLVFSDKSGDENRDIWLCLNAETGAKLWAYSYPAKQQMDFTSAARATPVIIGDKVVLLGALGDLACCSIKTGKPVWKMNLVNRFGGEVPKWGFSATPLVVGEKMLLFTGATNAALVALDWRNGNLLWKTPGNEAAYNSLTLFKTAKGCFAVGLDKMSIRAWDIEDGKVLWSILPAKEGDYNAPSSLNISNRFLLVSTEGNGTRLYQLGEKSTDIPHQAGTNDSLRPDSTTPIFIDGCFWGTGNEGACCIRMADMKTLWQDESDVFKKHSTLLGGNGHVLIASQNGNLYLYPSCPSAGMKPKILTIFESDANADSEVWSHSALTRNRMYIRNQSEVVCIKLESNKLPN